MTEHAIARNATALLAAVVLMGCAPSHYNPADALCLDKGGDVYWTTAPDGHLVCKAPR